MSSTSFLAAVSDSLYFVHVVTQNSLIRFTEISLHQFFMTPVPKWKNKFDDILGLLSWSLFEKNQITVFVDCFHSVSQIGAEVFVYQHPIRKILLFFLFPWGSLVPPEFENWIRVRDFCVFHRSYFSSYSCKIKWITQSLDKLAYELQLSFETFKLFNRLTNKWIDLNDW